MEQIKEIISEFEARDITNVIIAILVIILFYVMSSWLSKMSLRIFKIKEKDKKKIKESDTYKGLRNIFMCIGFYIALAILSIPTEWNTICVKIIKIIIIFNVAKAISGLISANSILVKKVTKSDKFVENESAVKIVIKIVKVLIYTIAVFIIIAELGYDLSGIVTGLGLGSVVIALAAQELVSNLLSGVAIASEKPFQIGDWITVGDVSGTVIDIKFRSVKIQTVDNTIVTIQNTNILSEAIVNSASIETRKLEISLRLPLNTTVTVIEELMKSISNIFDSIQEVKKDTFRVNIDEIQTDAIVIKIFMYVNIPGYTEFLKFKNKVNLCMLRLLEDKNIKLANTSTDIYLNEKGGEV